MKTLTVKKASRIAQKMHPKFPLCPVCYEFEDSYVFTFLVHGIVPVKVFKKSFKAENVIIGFSETDEFFKNGILISINDN